MIMIFVCGLLLLCNGFLIYQYIKLSKYELTSLNNKLKEKKEQENELDEAITKKEEEIYSLMEKARQTSQHIVSERESMEYMLIDAMSNTVERYRKDQVALSEQAIKQKRDELEASFIERAEQLRCELGLISEDVVSSKAELATLRQSIEIANKAILAQRALEEKQDFYRICLSEEAITDITILHSIRQNLHNRENLDKMIYDNYIAKPTLEMIKRVLEGKAPSGIYKITRLKTGEIYIGRSTDVKARWQQHVKTAFNCGTIAHSILHRTIEKDGIENFTFELVEEVPKDKLGEREKFWIDFYGSKQYGLNEKAGG